MTLLFFSPIRFCRVVVEDSNIIRRSFLEIPEEEYESSVRDNLLKEGRELTKGIKDEILEDFKEELKEEVKEELKEEVRKELKEEVNEELKGEVRENIVKGILKQNATTTEVIKEAEITLKYPFGVIDLSNLRNNTYSKINTKTIARRMNMNPYFNLQLNKDVNSSGVDIYEIERLIHSFSVSAFHATIPFQKGDFNKEIYGMKAKGDLFSILSLYLKSTATLNINAPNILVLPDEYFIDNIENIYGDSEEVDLNKLQEFKKSLKDIRQKMFEVLNSINMYPLFCMPSSTLQLSENKIKEEKEIFSINYSRELITISFMKEKKIKRWSFFSKFGSTNFKNRFIKFIKERIKKANYNPKYNILEDTKDHDSSKTNIVFVNDFDFGLFSNPPSSNSLLNIEDLKYSILPINELIDTFLININTYKFRLALYEYPLINHNSLQIKNKISAGMFPPIELDMEDLRKELTEEFHKEMQGILCFIKNTEEFKSQNLINKVPLIITPFPSNIIHSNIKFIKSQLNLFEGEEFDISYPLPSQSFEYKEDEYITPGLLDISNIKTEADLIVNETQIHKLYGELIKEIRTCKYVEFLPIIKKLKEELKNIKDVSVILDIKKEGIKEIKGLLKTEMEIRTDFDMFGFQLKMFNTAYTSYLKSTELCILGADVLKEYEEFIKDDYYKGDERKRSCVSKHMEGFIVKMRGIENHLKEMEKEVEREQKEKLKKEELKKETSKSDVSKEENKKEKVEVSEDTNKIQFNKFKDIFKTKNGEKEPLSEISTKDENTANIEESPKDEQEEIEKEIDKLLKEINSGNSRLDL